MISDKAIRSLKKAVKKSVKDKFEIGTVIRFTSGGRYTYAVIKTAVGWISTARYDNGFVDKTMTFEKLVKILGGVDITDVSIATAWESLD